jgi:osmotically-inducible protein OsmY
MARSALRYLGIGVALAVGGAALHALREARARAAKHESSDEVLVERVRAQIGRPLARPRAMQVFAKDGCIELRGDVYEGELRGLLSRVRSVRGVKDVVDHLTVLRTPDRPPPLTGRR